MVPRFSWAPDENSEIVGFQREYVWPRTKSDRFIESLLLGLPVPGVFLVREPTGRQREDELKQIFNDTVTVLDEAVGVRAFRPARAVNAAVVDSVMTGLARRIKRYPISDPSQVEREYATLMKNESYRKAVETGTSQESNVETRLELATRAFADVK